MLPRTKETDYDSHAENVFNFSLSHSGSGINLGLIKSGPPGTKLRCLGINSCKTPQTTLDCANLGLRRPQEA